MSQQPPKLKHSQKSLSKSLLGPGKAQLRKAESMEMIISLLQPNATEKGRPPHSQQELPQGKPRLLHGQALRRHPEPPDPLPLQWCVREGGLRVGETPWGGLTCTPPHQQDFQTKASSSSRSYEARMLNLSPSSLTHTARSFSGRQATPDGC